MKYPHNVFVSVLVLDRSARVILLPEEFGSQLMLVSENDHIMGIFTCSEATQVNSSCLLIMGKRSIIKDLWVAPRVPGQIMLILGK